MAMQARQEMRYMPGIAMGLDMFMTIIGKLP